MCERRSRAEAYEAFAAVGLRPSAKVLARLSSDPKNIQDEEGAAPTTILRTLKPALGASFLCEWARTPRDSILKVLGWIKRNITKQC